MGGRILLGQLGAGGDCLCATAVARQIKEDHPGCHLTWAIGSMYAPMIRGNPHVDAVHEIPLRERGRMAAVWRDFARRAARAKADGKFDEVFLTQIYPDNYQNFDGTLRTSIFRGYPRPITVPVQPVLRLAPGEVENVRNFARRHALEGRKHVLLFEAAAYSQQSFVDPAYAVAVAQAFVGRVPEACVVISSGAAIESGDARIVDGSALSLRENAELTKHCSLFVGSFSGITWAINSDWAKPLPQVQVLSGAASVFASSCHDAAHFGLPGGHILELQDCTAGQLADCLEAACTAGFAQARANFHQVVPLHFDFYLKCVHSQLVVRRRYGGAAQSIAHTMRRYGRTPELLAYARKYVLPNLKAKQEKLLA